MDLVKIRPATKEDAPTIAYLIQLLLEHLKGPTRGEQGLRDLLRYFFGEAKYAHAIVAELLSDPAGPEGDGKNELPSSRMDSDKRIIGHATYYYGYSTWEGHLLFVEDLFVKEEMRGKGVGTALLKECAKIAVANDCSRMTWQAIDGDTNAKRFYEQRVGATCQKEWLTYKLLKGDKFYNGNSDGVMDLVKIRPATKEDVPSIAYLTQVLAEFENEPNAPKLGEKEFLKDLFGEGKYANAVVVELLSDPEGPESVVPNELPSSRMSRNKRIVGHGIYYYRYSTSYGHHLYIEDVFVKAEMRNKGIGAAIFRECTKIAAANGCSEMRWQVLDWNTDAVRFYEKHIGASCLREWLTYCMKREEFTVFAEGRGTHKI